MVGGYVNWFFIAVAVALGLAVGQVVIRRLGL
jgi:hypothetical protein